MFENVMHAGLPFYASQVDPTGRKGASLESKILLPLKTLAFRTAETCIFGLLSNVEGSGIKMLRRICEHDAMYL